METFAVRNLTFSYPGQEIPVLNDISFSILPGQFVTLCGASGSGKTTLLRHLKPALTPAGIRKGEILYEGVQLSEVSPLTQAASIGFVQQSPDNQIVTDKVWHELAFGLESLGCDTRIIRGRVAETASFFGIGKWFHQDVSELSGGQKQLLNLASVMVMHPEVLILDEPTSQLDPVAASNFMAALAKINREMGITILITEQRLDELLPLSDRVLVMDKGKIIADGTPSETGSILKSVNHKMFLSMPVPMRVWSAVDSTGTCPVTIREGRRWLTDYAENHPLKELPAAGLNRTDDIAAELHNIWFRYAKDLPDVLKGVDLLIGKGEISALLGSNGAGKSTLLSVIGGLESSYRGRICVYGSVGILPQDPQTLFVKETVLEDLLDVFRGQDVPEETQQLRLDRFISLCRLDNLKYRHPYDLSEGERQRAALAKVLLTAPDILLLDEPTKGLDAEFKQLFGSVLKTLKKQGMTIIMVSHDIEFCAEFCDRCALLFDGIIVTENDPRAFFSGNSYYTTAANRMARELLPEAVTAADVITACGGVPLQPPELPKADDYMPEREICITREKSVPWWRKILSLLSAAAVFFSAAKILQFSDYTSLPGVRDFLAMNAGWICLLISGLLVFGISSDYMTDRRKIPDVTVSAKKRLSGRTVAALVMVLLLIPITLAAGAYLFNGRRYYITSLLVLLEAMLPFFLLFEGRRPKARELVVLASLCALAVACRTAFFMFPNFKPLLAVVILSGISLGGESGFLVGSLSVLASNTIFGQGPWTPWQMFAAGLCGLLAGILFQKGFLRRSLPSICVFGAFCTIVIYGGIMNPAAAMMWMDSFSLKMILPYYITGLPMDMIHALSTVLTLWFTADPVLKKIYRIRVRYGLME